MQRFRSVKTLQKFSSVHAQVHNHFNQERHLVTRQAYKTETLCARWPSGAPSRPNGRLGLGRAAPYADDRPLLCNKALSREAAIFPRFFT